MKRHIAAMVLLLGSNLGLSACLTRGSSTQTGSAYTVEVANTRHDTIQILFSDGGAERTLGGLGPGQSQRFRVNTLEPVVAIVARGTNGMLLYSVEVRLSNATTPSVSIR